MPDRQGRPPRSIECDPQRFELALWRALVGMGCDQFPAARLALFVVKGGPLRREDIEGALQVLSTQIPLRSHDPNDPDADVRHLSDKAKRQRPSDWLVKSAAMIQGLILFYTNNNPRGTKIALDALRQLGWGPVLLGLVDRIEAALKSNLAPADLGKLSPRARRLLARIRREEK
jgi:hypothetical protein